MTVLTKFPTTNAVHVTGLTDPNNAHADDGAYATTVPAKNNGKSTDYGTFGFDEIPSDATIDSVKIIYEYKVSITTSVAIARVNSVVSTIHDANHDDTSEPTTDTVKTIDVTADRSWTRANLLDGTFEVHLEGRRGNSNTSVTLSFDYVKVEVTYSAPVTIVKIVNETLNWQESPNEALSLVRVNNDILNWSEASNQSLTLVKVVNDILNWAESTNQAITLVRNINESLQWSEQVNQVLNLVRVVNETVNWSESTDKSIQLVKTINDILNWNEGLNLKITGSGESTTIKNPALLGKKFPPQG